jgi:amidase
MESGRPFGVAFAGTFFSEGVLIKLAFAYEQAVKYRKSPSFSE